jgi:PTS system nitrogen regulatory IIA component
MKLSEVIRLECVKPQASVEDKAMALCEIASLACKSPLCRNISEEAILEALQDRETLSSTALGNGVAIPHCRLSSIHDFVVGMMSVPDGVDFEAPDGKKISLIIFFIAPTTDNGAHVRLLSAISQALQDPAAVKKMTAAKTAKSLVEKLIQAAESDIPVYESSPKNRLTIAIQDQTAFNKILSALAGIEGVSLSILESQNAYSYLKSIPLFAALSEQDHPAFSKQIVAVIERKLSNEIIRRIETITGSLSECSGILVTVQELTFCAGMLEL